MNRKRWFGYLLLTGGLMVGVLLEGCATKVTTGAFTQVGRIQGELTRGVSTKMDVQRLLGTPKGSGGAVLPTDSRPREVWYYEDIEMLKIKSEKEGPMRADMRQQILLIFFEKGVFDGFMWWSNAGTATAQ